MGFMVLQAHSGAWWSDQFAASLDSLSGYGIDMFEEDIDDVIFHTNDFLTNPTFSGSGGPFWYILQISMCLGALFAIIMAAGMAYKMMVKGEPFDVLKVLKVLGVALVMCWWYPPSNTGFRVTGAGGSNWCILDMLAYIPNCVGSWTHDLYTAEAAVVEARLGELTPKYNLVQQFGDSITTTTKLADQNVNNSETTSAVQDVAQSKETIQGQYEIKKMATKDTYASFIVAIDKIMMFLSIILYRIGFSGTIYCQQILLGMLTIFGPIQWAFSLLPKWEGVWAKWTTRYLTVHFYGAMLYFVGFYVLLLFDIVLSVQYEDLKAATEVGTSVTEYIGSAFFSAGYMLVASIVALKCLNLVPDLAAWMIPEGDTAFSTRNFGEGVAAQAKASATGILGSVVR